MEIGLMSVIVFAGSSQFIAVSMLAAGASMVSIVATAFIVNLRHFLMSSALAVYLKNSDRTKLTFFSYGVTDESFAVNLTRFRESDWDLNSALVTNFTANITWLITTVLGRIQRTIYSGPCLRYRLCAGCHVHLFACISIKRFYLCHYRHNSRNFRGVPVDVNTGKFIHCDCLDGRCCTRCGFEKTDRFGRGTLGWCQASIWQSYSVWGW